VVFKGCVITFIFILFYFFIYSFLFLFLFLNSGFYSGGVREKEREWHEILDDLML
jgi:pilus assembly protein TadC